MSTFAGLSAAIAMALVIAGCGTGAPAATVAGPADAVEFAETMCDSTDAFFLAVGNPDAGTPSVAWAQFEDAIERGDVALLDQAGTTILGHIDTARAANGRGATFAPATAANAEFDALLTALDTQVRMVLEAKGDKAVARTAAEAAGGAWGRHWSAWLLALRALGESGIVMPNIPCDGGPPGPP